MMTVGPAMCRPLQLRTVAAARYVTPLREGGSLPAIIEADDDGLYVLKFRGAGQGAKALIAELVAGEIARALGLLVPEIVLVEVDIDLARTEPDPEIQELIRASAGINLALDFLPGATMFDPLADTASPTLASSIVWFDAFVSNVDRSARNVNMLMWHGRLWLIDHGAAFYVHHSSQDFSRRGREPFARIADHVLLPMASGLAEVDDAMSSRLSSELLAAIVAAVPNVWLDTSPTSCDAGRLRQNYVDYLCSRLLPPHPFVEEAIRARATCL
jgi:HipA-like protein